MKTLIVEQQQYVLVDQNLNEYDYRAASITPVTFNCYHYQLGLYGSREIGVTLDHQLNQKQLYYFRFAFMHTLWDRAVLDGLTTMGKQQNPVASGIEWPQTGNHRIVLLDDFTHGFRELATLSLVTETTDKELTYQQCVFAAYQNLDDGLSGVIHFEVDMRTPEKLLAAYERISAIFADYYQQWTSKAPHFIKAKKVANQ